MSLKNARTDRIRQRKYILALAGLTFLVLGKLAGEFPLLTFLGLAPLLALLHNKIKADSPTAPFVLTLYIVFLVSFILWNFTYPTSGFLWIFPLFYSLAALLPFLLFEFTNKHAKNRLGLFTLVIYWLAMEYIMFKIHPEFSRFWLGCVFNDNPHLISWNVNTGLLGVSLWIIMVNIMFYRALVKNNAVFKGNIHWLQIGLALGMICIPFFFNTETEAITRQDLLEKLPAMEKQLAGNGEYLGKTALWVTLLIVIYSFVKRKTNKSRYDRT